MVKFNRSDPVSGPSSAIGIMRFFDASTGGPKVTPEFIMIACTALVAVLIVLQLIS